jgi:hypothetical protein
MREEPHGPIPTWMSVSILWKEVVGLTEGRYRPKFEI